MKVYWDGYSFNRWTVVRFIGMDSKGQGRWLCRCACGTKRDITEERIRRHESTSCGCFQREQAAKLCRRGRNDHNLSKHPDFAVWVGMIARCHHPQHPRYKDYGGRGIYVCARWHLSPALFFEDMGPRPHGYTIERKDNDLGYCPENCVWVPRSEQAKNQRTTVRLTLNGETLHLSEWARRVGISASRLSWRLHHGWDLQEALSIKPSCANSVRRPKGDLRKHKYAGEQIGTAKLTAEKVLDIRASSDSITGLAQRYGVSRSAIFGIRARRSWKHV